MMLRVLPALLVAALSGCVQTGTAGEVVTSVRRSKTGDLMVERCALEVRTTYIVFPVGVEAARERCVEKVIP